MRLVVESATYDTETEQLKVKLKPIFQALRIVKDNQKFCNSKVTTLPKVSSKTVLDYLTKNIELSLKNHVTTLERLAITKKEPLDEALSKNGASDGIVLDFASLGQDFPALRLSSNLTSLLRHSLRSAYAKSAEPKQQDFVLLGSHPYSNKKRTHKGCLFLLWGE